VKKITKAVQAFKSEGKWQWLCDLVGIGQDGQIKPKQATVIAALKDIDNEDVQELLLEISDLKPRDAAEVTRRTRTTPAEKAVKQAEVAKLLADLPISEEEKARMLKAV
jgi:hypothetical protein